MTIEDTIKKLTKDNDRLWKLVYGRWKKRRSRNKGKLSLQRCREKALIEYYTLKEQIKNNDTTPSNINEETDFWVMVGGVSMLNSKYKELIAEQERVGNVEKFPSRHPDSYAYVILKSLFKDKTEDNEGNSTDLWND